MDTTQKTSEQVWIELEDGQRQAIVRKVVRAQTGDESQVEQVLRAVLSGELRVVLVDGVVKFFDHTGRGIPMAGLLGKVLDPDRSFYLTQPSATFAVITERLQKVYGKKVKLLPAAEFEARCNAALEGVRSNPQIANLLNGPHFAWQMPQLSGDLGTFLDDMLAPALERSYKAQFPDRQFKNYRHGELAGRVTVIVDTRQERLIDTAQQGPVCGVYFPCLQGFSIPSSRAFIGHVPEQLILAGVEVLAAATAHPEIIGRDWKTLGLDMAALQWQDPGYSLRCEANGAELNFGSGRLGADDYYAGGVSLLG